MSPPVRSLHHRGLLGARRAGLAALLAVGSSAEATLPAEDPASAADPPAEQAPPKDKARRKGIPEPSGSRGSMLSGGVLPKPYGRFDGDIAVQGSADEAAVLKAVQDWLPQYQYCYTTQRDLVPPPNGAVVLELRVAPVGAVTAVELQSTTLDTIALEDCVVRYSKSLKLPQSSGELVVTIPLAFGP